MSINETCRAEIRQALHEINNSLHVLGLQVELARLHLENGNAHEARSALEQALRERSHCGQTTRSLQDLVRSV